MPKGFFDDARIDLPCPECRRKVAASIGQLKRNPTLQCGAGHRFDVDAKQAKRELDKVDKAISNLGKGWKV